jgi:hypothetical protein
MKKLIYFYLFLITTAVVVDVYFVSAFSHGLGYPPIKSDGEGYYAYLPTILIHKTIDFRVLEHSHFQEGIPKWTGISLNASTGMLMNRYPIGVAVLMSPFFLVAHFLTKATNLFAPDGYSLIYQCSVLVSALFYYLIGSYFLFKSLLNHFSKNISLVTIVFITFGTSLFHYTTFDGVFSHVYTFCLVSVLIYLTAKFWTKPSYRNATLVGISIGLLFLIRNYNLIYIIYFLLYPLSKTSYIGAFFKAYSLVVDKCLTILLLAFITVTPQLVIWKITTGNFITYSYGEYGFNWLSPQILNVLFSFDNGLFIYYPTLIFAVLGLILGYKQKHDKSLKTIAAISIYILLLLTYIISSWRIWNFGASFGHRGFVDAYPFFAFGFAIAIQACSNNLNKILIFAVLIALTIVVNIHMYNYWILKEPPQTPTEYIQAISSFPKRVYVNLFVPDKEKSTNIDSGLKALVNVVNGTKIPELAKPNQIINVKYSVLNTGKSYWMDTAPLVGGKVSLGVIWFPQIAKSKSCERQPQSITQTRIPLPDIVSPGERVELHGSVQVPKISGQYTMLVEMVSDGVAWFKDVGDSSVSCYDILVKKF